MAAVKGRRYEPDTCACGGKSSEFRSNTVMALKKYCTKLINGRAVLAFNRDNNWLRMFILKKRKRPFNQI